MKTNQPKWERRKDIHIGDVSPLIYGGGYVYVDRTKHYVPEMDWIVSDNEESNDGRPWTIYRILIEDVAENEWWWERLGDVAASTGQSVEELQARAKSSDLADRVLTYVDLLNYFGPFEFDQYPTTYTKRSDLPRRLRRMSK